MISAGNNHPWKRFFIRRDEISIAEGPTFSELPSDEILNPTPFKINPEKQKSTKKSVPAGVFSLSLLPIRLLPEAAKVLLHLLFSRHNGKCTASCRHKRSCRIGKAPEGGKYSAPSGHTSEQNEDRRHRRYLRRRLSQWCSDS